MSLDPVQGCPYRCFYCVLRHAGGTGVRPRTLATAKQCVDQLLAHPLFVPGETAVAIGNETDMCHPINHVALLGVLDALASHGLGNPVFIPTKAPLAPSFVKGLRDSELRITFCLSYSGLGRAFEPDVDEQAVRQNFSVLRDHGFPMIHFWRPLLGPNSRRDTIRTMLALVSQSAAASVVVGLKLHPELNRIIGRGGRLRIPDELMDGHGEWADRVGLERIWAEAAEVCPDYPLYRHTSCAMARIGRNADHTGTVFREDVCPPSRCPREQRRICLESKTIPSESEIGEAVARLSPPPEFRRGSGEVRVLASVTQEEYAYLVHRLKCPIRVRGISYTNLYHGSIFARALGGAP